MFKNKFLSGFLLLAFVTIIMLKCYGKQQHHVQQHKQQPSIQNASGIGSKQNSTVISKQSIIPQKVYDVLAYVKKYHKAPDGYVGGREFKNLEHHLSVKTMSGTYIRYQEWDVNRKVDGQNRGAERLVTGNDDKAWYSNDHYQTFKEVK